MSSLLKGAVSLEGDHPIVQSFSVSATNKRKLLNITPTSNVISGNLTVTDTNNTTLFSITSGIVNAVALTINGVTAATTTYVDNAISTALRLYVTESYLTSTLATYVTASYLTSALASYVTASSLTSTLASYVTTNQLVNALNNSAVQYTSALTSYVTSSSLTTTLTSYVTSSSLTTTLSSYITSSYLTSRLASVVASCLPITGGTISGNLTCDNLSCSGETDTGALSCTTLTCTGETDSGSLSCGSLTVSAPIALSSSISYSSAVPSTCIGYIQIVTNTNTTTYSAGNAVILSINLSQGVWLLLGTTIFHCQGNVNWYQIGFTTSTTTFDDYAYVLQNNITTANGTDMLIQPPVRYYICNVASQTINMLVYVNGCSIQVPNVYNNNSHVAIRAIRLA